MSKNDLRGASRRQFLRGAAAMVLRSVGACAPLGLYRAWRWHCFRRLHDQGHPEPRRVRRLGRCARLCPLPLPAPGYLHGSVAVHRGCNHGHQPRRGALPAEQCQRRHDQQAAVLPGSTWNSIPLANRWKRYYCGVDNQAFGGVRSIDSTSRAADQKFYGQDSVPSNTTMGPDKKFVVVTPHTPWIESTASKRRSPPSMVPVSTRSTSKARTARTSTPPRA